MYLVRGSDQVEYGPVDAETVRRWLAEGRANSQTLLRLEGGTDWKPLGEFPEFNLASGADSVPPPIPGLAPVSQPRTSPEIPRTSGLAVTSLVLGILGLLTCGISSLVGFVLGIVALAKIRNSNGALGGRGVAIAGICLSVVFMLFGLLFGAGIVSVISNTRSRAQQVNMTQGPFPPQAMNRARTKAQQISCVSNLKQIGLAARMWSNDHNDTFPPDFLSMSNELFSPKILVCPDDAARKRVETWPEFDPKNVSYEYLKPGVKEDPALMKTPIFRCPIHNNVCYGDGSVRPEGVGVPPPRNQ